MKISLERMIQILKFFMKLCADSLPSKRYLILRKTWWIIAMSFTGHAMVQCFQEIMQKPDDPIRGTQTITEVGPTLLSFSEMGIFKYRQELLKVTWTHTLHTNRVGIPIALKISFERLEYHMRYNIIHFGVTFDWSDCADRLRGLQGFLEKNYTWRTRRHKNSYDQLYSTSHLAHDH